MGPVDVWRSLSPISQQYPSIPKPIPFRNFCFLPFTVTVGREDMYLLMRMGWELLSINGNQITMSRETQNPHYVELVKYQAKYEEMLNEYNSIMYPDPPAKPYPIEFKTCFWTFVALIVPFVFYIRHKIKQKKQYQEDYANYMLTVDTLNARKKHLREEMDNTVLQSRGVFFSQN